MAILKVCVDAHVISSLKFTNALLVRLRKYSLFAQPETRHVLDSGLGTRLLRPPATPPHTAQRCKSPMIPSNYLLLSCSYPECRLSAQSGPKPAPQIVIADPPRTTRLQVLPFVPAGWSIASDASFATLQPPEPDTQSATQVYPAFKLGGPLGIRQSRAQRQARSHHP